MSADKFQNKYRIPSARAEWWDYGNNASYFITICLNDKSQHLFGEIPITDTLCRDAINGVSTTDKPQIYLSPIGEIAESIWKEIPSQFPYVKLELDEFAIMPNHIHGIISIDKPDGGNKNIQTQLGVDVETRLIASLRDDEHNDEIGGITGNHNPMLHDNLSRVLRWYKGRVKFEAGKINPEFKWQTRFHDRIIRDHEEYRRIFNYIETNVENWHQDKHFG